MGFEIWYVEKFPLGEFDLAYTSDPAWQKRNESSIELMVNDIQRQGLVNPLICRYRKSHGDTVSPVLLVGGVRLFVLRTKLGWTHAPMVVCGEGGRKYEGGIKYTWEDPVLHALFKDGYLGLNTTGLCMARCSNRSRGEVPGPDSPMTYREKFSDTQYVERPPGAPPVRL